MASILSDGVTIAYDDIAPPVTQGTIILIHGFASNRNEGWKRTGWYAAFERRGLRVIALDQRAIAQPDRVDHLILGGIGGKFLEPREDGGAEKMVEAMLADDPATITEPMLRSFRQFADEQGEDRKALAALTQVRNMPFDHDALRELRPPVLVVTGAGDTSAGDPEDLARIFPNGHGKTIPGCDHFSAIPHALTKAAVFDFLDGLMDDDFPPFE